MHLRKIVIASGNSNKFEEFRELLAPIGIELLFGREMSLLEVEETGASFLENASLKALVWAEETGIPSLADDSGIEVDALGGKPGIYSARVASDDEGCRDWLLKSLKNERNRKARYTAALVLASAGGIVWSVEEYCCGTVAKVPRGIHGFGYDPIFVPEGYDMTFGELDPSIKARISHRAKAANSLLKWLASAENMVQ